MTKQKEPKEEANKSQISYIYIWIALILIAVFSFLVYLGIYPYPSYTNKDNCQIVEYKGFMTPYTCNQMGQALLLQISLPKIEIMGNKICYNLNIITNITQDISYFSYIGGRELEQLFLKNCLLKLT